MKKLAIIFIMILLLFVAGCSTVQSSSPKQSISLATTTASTPSISEPVNINSNGFSVIISVNKLKSSYSKDVNLYYILEDITIKNTGTKALDLACYNTITDYAGVSTKSGGIGTGLIYPGDSTSIKDLTVIASVQSFNALSKESKLDVTCRNTRQNGMNFQASWNVNPSDIQ